MIAVHCITVSTSSSQDAKSLADEVRSKLRWAGWKISRRSAVAVLDANVLMEVMADPETIPGLSRPIKHIYPELKFKITYQCPIRRMIRNYSGKRHPSVN